MLWKRVNIVLFSLLVLHCTDMLSCMFLEVKVDEDVVLNTAFSQQKYTDVGETLMRE